ncbi:MAG: substrate-binding domain-containing protein [Alphaproteobacteria bacterium]|nr:substrate-binding domain-containing protein [Alphaproteobacteria bacterium]
MNLKELARHLNLSPTTVSRALNGYPEVSEATRRRVSEAAAKFQYRPSATAARLATGKSRTIGHLTPLGAHDMINPHFSDFLAGAGEVYAARDYDVLFTVVRPEEEAEHYRTLARSGRVDGVILHAPVAADPRIPLLAELRLPFICHGRSHDMPVDYAWLDVNNRRSFKRATEFLLDLGHTRLALINGLETMSFAHRRRLGFEEALGERSLRVDPDLIRSADMTEPFGYHAARDMLGRPDSPTAFLTSSSIIAIGVARAAQEQGYGVGRDVSIVTHDDCLSAFVDRDDVPVFTAVRSSIREAGKRAAEMLLDTIEEPGGPPAQELWEAELVIGRSTGPAPRAG